MELTVQCYSRRPEFEGAYDPHVWFDVGSGKVLSKLFVDTLIEGTLSMPENTNEIQEFILPHWMNCTST